MNAHPCADLLPAMSEDEYRALVASIQENGLREPIVTIRTPDSTQILDGRHRHRACLELGVTFSMIPYEGPADAASLRAFVLDKNLVRRHLSESQRKMVAARLAGRGWVAVPPHPRCL